MEIAKLDVQISADAKPLVTALNQSNTALQGFGTQAELSARHSLALARGIQQLGVDASYGQINMSGLFETLRVGATEFNNIKRETGSASKAFSELGDAIFSTQTVALIIITSLGLLVSKLLETSKAEDVLTSAIDDANKQFAEQAGKTTEILSKVQALLAASRDLTISTENRNAALNEAKKLAPEYLNNLTLETVNTDLATNAVNRFTEALDRKAKSEALAALISKTYSQIIETQNKPLNENIDLWDKIKGVFQGGIFGQNQSISLTTSALQNQGDAIGQLQKLLDGYEKQLFSVTQAQAAAGDFLTTDKGKANAVKAIKNVADAFETIKNIQLAIIDNNQKIETFATPKVKAVAGITPNQSDAAIELLKKVQAQTALATEAAQELGQAFANTFKELITHGTVSIRALENAIGNLVGKLLQAVVEAALLSAILSFIPGAGTTIQGGIGFANLFKGLLGFADGGIVGGPMIAKVGESGPEAIIPLDRLQQMIGGLGGSNISISGELRAHGTDLVVALNRGNVRINRNYGQNFTN